MSGKNLKWLILTVGVLSLGTIPAFSQPANEGYDPMLQITHQFAHPNLLLVLDVTGSMAWGPATSSGSVDDQGLPSWGSPVRSNKGTSPCNSSNYKYIYTLSPVPASRMCTVKNALGNSVITYNWDFASVNWSTVTATGWTYMGTNTNGYPQWYKCSTSTTTPAVPFAITTSCPGLIANAPKDLLGQTKSSVNWAVAIFSTDYADCSKATLKTKFDLTESGDLTAIYNLLKLNSAGGLAANGSTNTRGAMTFARTVLQKTVTGGSFTDYKNVSWTVTRDNKFFSCQRTYGTILVTDGLSNSCNETGSEDGHNWINPCDSSVPAYTCDSSGGAYDCDRRSGNQRRYYNFAPGNINDLYNSTITDGGKTWRLNAKTWVIGVSNAVSPCELNFDAYLGRTDASATKGDAGFDTSANLARMPNMVMIHDANTDKDVYTTLIDNEETTSHYNTNDPRTTNKHYAYFATNANALADAFAAIVAGVATGDYTTSAPVASPSTASGTAYSYLPTADFPEWKGHLYCWDAAQDPPVFKWDAGEMLLTKNAADRKIYTWNTSKALVEVTTGNLSTLKLIATSFTSGFDSTKLTTQVIDFIRGNNGSGVTRSWRLGPIVNSTPTLIISPQKYETGNLDTEPTHDDFISAYGSRKPLIYVGSNDGMLHAFLTTDEEIDGDTVLAGTELFAILPPNLISTQVTLYNNFKDLGMVTGQAKQPKDHIYGVANSPRYGDVFFPGESKWRTVLYLTEGPGGALMAALDITDPFGKMTQPTPELPVSVLWYHTTSSCAELKSTWSVPAIASSSAAGAFKGIMGTGYDSVSATTSPYALTFNPTDGTLVKKSISAASTPSPYSRNQAFSDSVIFQTTVREYYPDNIADLALQPDLQGRIWFYKLSDNSLSIGINASAKATQCQPLYYPPAVSGYKQGVGTEVKTYDLYVFASGTYYEKDTDVTGVNVGTTGFIPSLYVAVTKDWGTTSPSTTNTLQIPIKSLTYGTSGSTLGVRTQVATSPILLVPTDGVSHPQALFACYDPDTADCAGTSYVVLLDIAVGTTGLPTVTKAGYSAGSGAISGFAIVGNKVVVARSGVGEGAQASLSTVPGVEPITGQANAPRPVWWRELQ
jgi:hypothetical protein